MSGGEEGPVGVFASDRDEMKGFSVQGEVARRFAKLLKQAESVAGTPEADAFTEKAMALIAEYGIQVLDSDRTDSADGRQIVLREIEFEGNGADGAITVLAKIGRALHCQVVYEEMSYEPDVYRAEIYGAEIHVERVLLLIDHLAAQCSIAAARDWRQYRGKLKAKEYLKIWHQGFGKRIAQRLSELEARAVHRVAEDSKGMELVLLSDSDRAKSVVFEIYPHLANQDFKRSLKKSEYDAFDLGMKSGDEADINQPRLDK